MSTHTQRLATAGHSVRQVSSRIVATWQQATYQHRRQGAAWYPKAGKMIGQLSKLTGLPKPTVAAVVAHLSPRTRWSHNVTAAQTLLLTGQDPHGCLGANIARARLALASKDPLATLNGPKVRRFAANLLGDTDQVTIDVWAARVALGDDPLSAILLGRVGMYEAVEHCYRLAARRVAIAPAVVQATTWIVARGGRTE